MKIAISGASGFIGSHLSTAVTGARLSVPLYDLELAIEDLVQRAGGGCGQASQVNSDN